MLQPACLQALDRTGGRRIQHSRTQAHLAGPAARCSHPAACRWPAAAHLYQGVRPDVGDVGAVSPVQTNQHQCLDAPQARVPDRLADAAESLGGAEAWPREPQASAGRAARSGPNWGGAGQDGAGQGGRGVTCGELLLKGVVQDLDVLECGLERLGCDDAAVICIRTSTD